MIKAQILLWKTIEGNKRLRVKVRFRFLSLYSELAPTDPWCNMLQTLPGRKKYEKAMSDEHPCVADILRIYIWYVHSVEHSNWECWRHKSASTKIFRHALRILAVKGLSESVKKENSWLKSFFTFWMKF